jgi:hypothetical protein
MTCSLPDSLLAGVDAACREPGYGVDGEDGETIWLRWGVVGNAGLYDDETLPTPTPPIEDGEGKPVRSNSDESWKFLLMPSKGFQPALRPPSMLR